MTDSNGDILRLALIRHAQAEDAMRFAHSGRPDAERALTDEGHKRAKRAARGLIEAVDRLDAVWTSPLLRARQTAEYVAAEASIALRETDLLVPETRVEVQLEWLAGLGGGTIALVGHEPNLSTLAGWLVAGRKSAGIEMKKGAACLIGFTGEVQAGKGILHWLLPQSILRRR